MFGDSTERPSAKGSALNFDFSDQGVSLRRPRQGGLLRVFGKP